MAFPFQITDADGTLIINQLMSEGFQTGVTGWEITKDGDAEFNSINIRSTDLVLTGVSITNIGSGIFSPADLVYWQLGNLVFYNIRAVATAAGSGTGNVGFALPFTLVNANSVGRQLTQLAQVSYTGFSGASGVAALTVATGAGTVLSGAGGLTQIRAEQGEFIRGGHIIIGSQIIVHGIGITT